MCSIRIYETQGTSMHYDQDQICAQRDTSFYFLAKQYTVYASQPLEIWEKTLLRQLSFQNISQGTLKFYVPHWNWPNCFMHIWVAYTNGKRISSVPLSSSYQNSITQHYLSNLSSLSKQFKHEDALYKARYLRHLQNSCHSTAVAYGPL